MGSSTTEIDPNPSGEHPLVQVVQHKPLPGRRWFGAGWVLMAIALILGILLIGVPVSRIVERSKTTDRQLACRNRIGNALQEAQAVLTVHLAEGLTIVVRNGDTEPILTEIDADRARVRSLAELRGQSVEICEQDASFQIPAELASP